ncbi:MAG: transglutaminase-like domain-containing protein [Bacteroidia bacterium]
MDSKRRNKSENPVYNNQLPVVMDVSTLKAMIRLLDDPDEAVVEALETRFMEEGEALIDDLEAIWLANEFPSVSSHIELLIKRIQKRGLHRRFKNWFEQEQPDLIEGWFLVTQVQYPGLKIDDVRRTLSDIKLDVWLMMGNVENDLDKIQILNHVFFDQQGFHGDNSQYHYTDNSFINRVLERKSGNPISLSVVYMTVAQSLGLPVFGVNLPQHFVVGFCQLKEGLEGVKNLKIVGVEDIEKTLFYINPYSKGQIFTKENVDAFLKVVNVSPQKQFYHPCGVKEIVKRMLRNLHFSYGEIQELEKQQEVLQMMKLAGMWDELEGK